jgi:pimeloyl-ACP methyl ester carboxylesterase
VINGLAGTSRDWDPGFLEGLAARNELMLPDNRGIGESPDDGEPFGIADLAEDCAGLMARELGGQPAVVLGWSMGGFIAQLLALTHPELVSKLVLLASHHGGPGVDPGDPQVLAQLVDLSPPPDDQARRLLALLFDEETGRALYPQVGELVAAARGLLSQDLLDRQRNAIDGWVRTGVADRLGELDLPVLVAAGSADRVIPPVNSLALAEAIQDAWLLRFRGGGHAFMAQHPARLAGMINEFVAL